jgi:hypothetical protein
VERSSTNSRYRLRSLPTRSSASTTSLFSSDKLGLTRFFSVICLRPTGDGPIVRPLPPPYVFALVAHLFLSSWPCCPMAHLCRHANATHRRAGAGAGATSFPFTGRLPKFAVSALTIRGPVLLQYAGVSVPTHWRHADPTVCR